MDWFSALFATAAVLALLTGKAYFRGVTARAENPARYWSIIGCYIALALLMPVLRLLRA
jgi:hypothetical protein